MWPKFIISIDFTRSIMKFIHNHAYVLSLMRKFTKNRELVHPSITFFTNDFIYLLSLLGCMFEIKRMFISNERYANTFSRKQEDRDMAKLVYQDSFWARVEKVHKVSESLVKVLHLLDGENPTMGCLYEAMDRAKEAICSNYEDKGHLGYEKQVMIWHLVDEQRNNMLHCPTHATRLFLKPLYLTHSFNFNGKVIKGFLTCLQRMVPNSTNHSIITREMDMYSLGIGLFSFDMVVQERKTRLLEKQFKFQ
jgi:hypothetical protein